jgi:hypothetical protein
MVFASIMVVQDCIGFDAVTSMVIRYRIVCLVWCKLLILLLLRVPLEVFRSDAVGSPATPLRGPLSD